MTALEYGPGAVWHRQAIKGRASSDKRALTCGNPWPFKRSRSAAPAHFGVKFDGAPKQLTDCIITRRAPIFRGQSQIRKWKTPNFSLKKARAGSQNRVSERVSVRFTGADAHRLLDRSDEYLAVTDLSGLGGRSDRFHDLVGLVRRDGHLDAHFR